MSGVRWIQDNIVTFPEKLHENEKKLGSCISLIRQWGY